MKKQTILLLTLNAILFSGCMTSVDTLNKRHKPTAISPRLVSQSAWSIDKSSFAGAGTIEVLPRVAWGNFTSVFEHNADQLMTSLFGTEKANVSNDQAEYILRVQIGNVFTKMGMFAWNESRTEIELIFKLERRQGGTQVAIAPVSVTGNAKGSTGNLYTFNKNAHNRANVAINNAFTEAQASLADALAKQSRQ